MILVNQQTFTTNLITELLKLPYRKWPSGRRHCNLTKRFSVLVPLRALQGLETRLFHNAPDEP